MLDAVDIFIYNVKCRELAFLWKLKAKLQSLHTGNTVRINLFSIVASLHKK